MQKAKWPAVSGNGIPEIRERNNPSYRSLGRYPSRVGLRAVTERSAMGANKSNLFCRNGNMAHRRRILQRITWYPRKGRWELKGVGPTKSGRQERIGRSVREWRANRNATQKDLRLGWGIEWKLGGSGLPAGGCRGKQTRRRPAKESRYLGRPSKAQSRPRPATRRGVVSFSGIDMSRAAQCLLGDLPIGVSA